MITSILMKNVASYKEAVLETDKKTNLIYGLNGVGKSTFSDFLYDRNNIRFAECKINGLDEYDKLLVYNQQFIYDNFYETENIQGIFTLSKENKQIKQLIDNANKDIKELSFQNIKYEKDKEEVSKKSHTNMAKYQKKFWEIKTDYAKTEDSLAYCLDGMKSSKDVLFNYLLSFKKSDKEIDYTIDDIRKEASMLQGDAVKLEFIKHVQIDCTMIESSSLLEKIIVGNKNSVVAELIDKLENSKWVEEGLQYVHIDEGDNTCPFCQEKTITSKWIYEIQSYFDKSYQEDKIKLEKMLEKYKEYVTDIPRIEYFGHNIIVDKYIKDIESILQDIENIFKENIRSLENKIQTPNVMMTLESTKEKLSELNTIIDTINEDIKQYNNKIENKQNSLNVIKNKFWYLMRDKYDAVIEAYEMSDKSLRTQEKELQDKIKENNKKIVEKQSIISENQKKTVNIDAAVEHINQELLDMGISEFSIVKHSEEEAMYRLKRGNNDTNIFKSLSEGEKMVISFLYFIECCKGEKRAEENSVKKIIVIDDPISSLSHIYVFNVGRLIHNEFLRTEKYEQVFILTHSLYFFYELTCMKKEDRDSLQKLFRLQKNDKGSYFTNMKYEEIQNDYQAYWSIINDKEQPPALIANCMRNVIEYFYNFVEKQDFTNVFQKPKLKEVRYEAFNRYMNRESHSKGQNIFDIKEFDYELFREAFKLVFEETGYSEHYKKMSKIHN